MKLFKKPLFTFILGALIFTGVGVYASEALRAQDILYSNSSDSNIASVKDALDKLYESGGSNKFCELKSGTALTVGAMYECDPGDGVKRNFYVLGVESTYVKLIMDRNLSETNITWPRALNYFDVGDGLDYRLAWSNVSNITFPSMDEIAAAVNYTSFDSTSQSYCDQWCFGSNANDTGNSTETCSNANQAQYGWLIENLKGCSAHGCANDNSSASTKYWTSTNNVCGGSYPGHWFISSQGGAFGFGHNANDAAAIRPVIYVLKSGLK